jgi:KDO2-lipid IV(A) lauroyltransferase
MIVLFWLFRILTKGFSKLPFWLVYSFSFFVAFLLNHVFRYRREVIVSNLQKSFPEKSITEIRRLVKLYYRNLADLAIETLKLENLSKKELFRRVTIEGENILEKYYSNKRGVVLVMSHFGNWEWASQRACFAGSGFDDIGVIAKEINNPYFDRYFTHIRLRLQKDNAQIIPFNAAPKVLVSKRHKASLIIAIADQSPHKDQIQFRTTFLNQDTPVFMGPERIARSLNYAVVFCHVKHTGRGFYKISFETVSDSPKDSAEYEITKAHVKMLEKDIIREPQTWLWSHRRWKY